MFLPKEVTKEWFEERLKLLEDRKQKEISRWNLKIETTQKELEKFLKENK